MAWSDYIRLATRNLTRRRLRSLLTLLGIIIGISVVVTFISLGDGLKAAVSSQLSTLGKDLIMVYPGAIESPQGLTGGIRFGREDADVLKGTPGIKTVGLIAGTSARVERKGELKVVVVHAMDPEIPGIMEGGSGTLLEEGRWPHEGAKEAAIGSMFANDLFDKPVRLRDKFYLNGVPIEVVGILKATGDPGDDGSGYMDYDVVTEATGGKLGLSTAMALLSPGADPERTVAAATKRLKAHRGVEDFTIYTYKQLEETINTVLGLIQLFLAAIASIALIVGAIGIMNTMYTSVIERTREIGALRSIGACDHDIMYIFMLESGILGLLGGAIGVLAGYTLGEIVEKIAADSGYAILQSTVSPELILMSLAFSFIIGLASGLLPARQASHLNPVDALRG